MVGWEPEGGQGHQELVLSAGHWTDQHLLPCVGSWQLLPKSVNLVHRADYSISHCTKVDSCCVKSKHEGCCCGGWNYRNNLCLKT